MSPNPTSNRADQIRQRRSSRLQSRTERAARYLSNPPVTVRGTGYGRPVIQRTASRPRRVFTVGTSDEGPTLSIPAPSLRVGWRSISGLLVLGLFILIYMMFNSSQFKVENIRINGASRMNAGDIEVALKLAGQSIFNIDPNRTAKDLAKAFPELMGISVAVGLPNSVTVQFEERLPIMAWKQKDLLRWVDQRGIFFTARGAAPENLVMVVSSDDPPRYQVAPTPGPTPTLQATPANGAAPTATPDPYPNRMDLQILSSALTLNNHLPSGATLIYSDKDGLGWSDPSGWEVYFGKTLDDLEMKISMAQAIAKQLSQKGIKPKYINLEYLNAPYYRLER